MAARAGHPAKFKSFLPERLTECIKRYRRGLAVNAWGIDQRRSSSGSGYKRLLVWKEMLQSSGYSNMGVFDESCSGTLLTGQTERAGLWPAKKGQV